MNICLLVMGIGMIIFPDNPFPVTGKPVAEQDGVDITEDKEAEITPTVGAVSPTMTAGATPEGDTEAEPSLMPAQTQLPTDIVTPTSGPEITEAVTPVPTEIPEDIVLQAEVPEDIITLVHSYFDALSTSLDDYKGLVFNQEAINEEIINLRVAYTVAYHNISCYMHEGVGKIDYIVYVLYDEEIPTITTYAPSIDYLLIRYENETPKIYLQDDKLTEEEIHYINTMLQTEDVTALVDSVAMRLESATQADEDLRKFMENIANQTGGTAKE